VVLAHALGLGGDVFRYGRGATLAGRLRRSGFSVYLLHHRGDRVAIAPRRRAGFDFDDILERDLPAALERVRLHSRCEQVHWVGHGLGGQLGLAFAGRYPGADLASVVALCAAVRFALPSSETRRIALSRAFLPAWWHLPTRAVASCAAPWIAEPGVGPRLRGVLRYAVEDVPIGLLRHAGRWLREGSLVDRTGLLDYRIAFADARVPLLAITAGGDRVCSEVAGAAALETWGCADKALVALPEAWGHLDVLLSPEADEQVFHPLTRWLSDRRRRAWDAPRLAMSGR